MPQVIAHRGALFAAPENTMEAFEEAAKIGCDGFELDVFRLRCGTLVVFHGDGDDHDPGYLEPYCGVGGNILDLDYEQVKRLRLIPNNQIFACPSYMLETSTIPTLNEVLEFAKIAKMHVKIELKGPGTELPCLDLVERMGMIDQCSFSSFFHDRIHAIRIMRPDQNPDGSYVYRTGALYNQPPEDFVQQCLRIGASEVHLKYDTCTKERVEAIHAAGMDTMAWFRGPMGMIEDATYKYLDVGNEDETMYETVMRSGVRSMCINKPQTLLNNLWLIGKQQQILL